MTVSLSIFFIAMASLKHGDRHSPSRAPWSAGQLTNLTLGIAPEHVKGTLKSPNETWDSPARNP